MNKKKLMEAFPLPDKIPADIMSRINRSRSINKNRTVFVTETATVGKTKVEVITAYNSSCGYYNVNQYNIVRFFFSKDDYLIYDNTGIGTGWENVSSYDQSPFRYYLKECIEDSFKISLKKDIYDYINNKINKINKEKKVKKAARQLQKLAKEHKQDMGYFKDDIPKSVSNKLIKNLPVYLFEYKDGNQNKVFCSKCNEKTVIEKFDKHLSSLRCPSCNAKGTVERMSMCKKWFEYHQHCMLPKTIDQHTTICSFYRIEQKFYKSNIENIIKNNKHLFYKIEEVNRIVIYDNKKTPHYYQKEWEGFYRVSKNSSDFKETSGPYGWYPNKFFVGDGIINDTKFFKNAAGWEYELQRYPRIAQLFMKKPYVQNWYWLDVIMAIAYHEPEILEKLTKVGLGYLTEDSDWWTIVKSSSETELHKILGVRKEIYKQIVKQKPDKYKIYRLQNIKMPFDDKLYKMVSKIGGFSSYQHNYYDYFYNHKKELNYLVKNEISLYTYQSYKDKLQYCNYPQIKLYLYPRDFKKMNEVVTKDYKDALKREEERQKKERERMLLMRQIAEASKRNKDVEALKADKTLTSLNDEQNKKMHLISEGLKKMKGIQDFMKGSHGLLVKVPENRFELKQEGIQLANCIGTYEERVSSGKTFIFFIREADNPDAPFFAMEYNDGEINQIRGFANRSAPTEIIDFCEGFAKYLKRHRFNPKKFLKAA